MAETVQAYPGEYPLGSGVLQELLSGNPLFSIALNTRDIYSAGAPDFVVAGPGSQVWILGYSIRVSRPPPFLAPATPLGLDLEVLGAYEAAAPFIFGTEQRIILPVFAGVHRYSGRARMESPVGIFQLNNQTGNDLEVSFQFWGKAI